MSEPCTVGIYGTQMWLWSLEILLILESRMDLDKKLYEVVIYLFIFVQCPRHGRLSAIVTDNYDKVSF